MEAKPKINLAIDGKEIIVDEGSTILEAAQQNGIHIPTLCHNEALSSYGGCRMCVVEVDGSPKLAASCVMPVRPGMEVVTSNDRIIEARRTVLEFLFAERNHYCMFCAQSGDCELQSLAYELQMDHLTVMSSYDKFPVDVTNEYMAIDHNRCILCGRCVRACKELAGSYVLNFQNRGPHALIGLDLNQTKGDSSCYSCGVCMQVCPTGAIYNRYRAHYAVKGHSKVWQCIESLCPQCGLMCPTIQFIKDNNLIKIEGKLSLNGGRPDHGQLCYKGRFECLKTVRNRLVKPIVRGKGGSWADETLENALDLVAQKLSSVRKAGGTVFGLASGRCAGEELFLFRKLMLEGFSAGCIDALDGDHFRNIVRAKSETGKSFKEASWKEIPEADFILVAGSEDPYQSQPIIATLMHRGVLERGLKVGIIGKTDFMSPWTHVYLSSNRFDELLIIKAFLEEASGIVKSSSKEEKSSVQEALNRIGLDGEACEKFYKMVNAFASARNPLIITGEGITGIKDISGMVNLMNLSILKGPFPGELPRLIILKRDGNSIGAWRLLLSNGNGVVNKENWKCGIMLLGGEEDFDADLLSRLDKLGFLAVISPNFPEALSSRAHVFIPKPHWTEEGGTYVSLDGMELGYKEKALNPPEEVKASWQVMMDLARRIKYKPGVKEWDEIRKKAEEEMRLGSSPIY